MTAEDIVNKCILVDSIKIATCEHVDIYKSPWWGINIMLTAMNMSDATKLVNMITTGRYKEFFEEISKYIIDPTVKG